MILTVLRSAGVRDQVLPVGDWLLELDGHSARSRRLLPLLGLPVLGDLCVHLPCALPRHAPRAARASCRLGHDRRRFVVRLDELRL